MSTRAYPIARPPAPLPPRAGIGYGLYLTLSTWALYYVATHTDFFDTQIGMFSLQEKKVSSSAEP